MEACGGLNRTSEAAMEAAAPAQRLTMESLQPAQAPPFNDAYKVLIIVPKVWLSEGRAGKTGLRS
jgi:hypothetical protein